MKCVVQRVNRASVTVDGSIVGCIPPGRMGLLVLCGLETGDTDDDLRWMSEKIVHLRIFTDEQGKMNRSVADINGGVLLVPNFTLAGSAQKGRRPSFDGAMPPESAEPAFLRFVEMVRAAHPEVQTGTFRTHMHVELENDGPVTLMIDSRGR